LRIQPVVEGNGEVRALPILLRRLRDESGAYSLEFNRPIRGRRSEFINEDALRKKIRLAKLQEACAGILVLLDADDDAPCEMGPRIQTWAREEAGRIPCAVVMAMREYEAWFLGSLESLRGHRGIRMDAVSHHSPELIRGAKEALERSMEPDATYFETTDQAALTALFDLGTAHQRCRSFRRLVRAFGLVASSAQGFPEIWPPATWGSAS
jgi:hypothetical protein